MRQDQWANTVSIDGVPWGVWDTLGGGAVEAADTKYRPGGMAPERSLGGHVTVSNLTLGRLLGREDWEPMGDLMRSRCGKANVVVSRQPLDTDGNPFGKPLVYSGTLMTVTPGDTDSESADAQVWEIGVSTVGSIG
jgi:hypothetical protein